MSKRVRYVVATVGGAALIGAVVTTAFAARPAPQSAPARPQAAKSTTFSNILVTNVAKVQHNLSIVSGRLYAHNGAQVWSGLTVKSGGGTIQSGGLNVTAGGITVGADGINVTAGGIKSDSLAIAGPASIGSNATITGNLNAGTLSTGGAINGASLSVTGGATIGSTLAAAGLSTTGAINGQTLTLSGGGSGPALTAAGVIKGTGVDAGQGGLITTGTVSGANGQFQNLAVSGTVNFSNAQVNGLNLTNLLNGGNLPNLTVGTTQATASPLNISENGQTASIGVSSGGAISVTNLTDSGALAVAGNALVSGSLTVSNAAGVITPQVQGTPSGGAAGPLALTGSTITLTGTTNLAGNTTVTGNETVTGTTTNTGSVTDNGTLTQNGNLTIGSAGNLVLGSASASSHILATGNGDVAGTLTVSVTSGTATSTNSFSFKTPYATTPYVVVTPTGDPAPGSVSSPKIWVNASPTGFTINVTPHYVSPDVFPGGGYPLTFNYHVIGNS